MGSGMGVYKECPEKKSTNSKHRYQDEVDSGILFSTLKDQQDLITILKIIKSVSL